MFSTALSLPIAGRNDKSTLLHRTLVTCLVFLIACPFAWAQSTTSLRGLVLDPRDAAVPGAVVKLVNVGTSVQYTLISDSSGGYHFPLVSPGNYRITAQKDGFPDVSVDDF